MRAVNKMKSYAGPAVACAVVFLCTTGVAIAGESASSWRPTYDLAMRWLNFGILAFLIVKFSREPLKLFLMGKKEEIAAEINAAEKALEKTTAQQQQTLQAVADRKEKFEEIKARIIRQGEREKNEIIDNARSESHIMLKASKNKIQGRIRQAKSKLREEMVDTAITLAMTRLPEQLTPVDNQKLLDQYIEATTKT